MRTLKPILLAILIACLSACSTTQSLPPTEKTRTVSQSCASQCEPLSYPADQTDKTLQAWKFQAIEIYGECRRQMADCIEWIRNAE